MLMWEISSGRPPFSGFDHDYHLAMRIANGMRPIMVSGTPLKYKNLMRRCWDADPSKRPDIEVLFVEIYKIYESSFESSFQNDQQPDINPNPTNSNSLTIEFSKIHIFESLPEPRNATDGKSLILYITIFIINRITNSSLILFFN